MAFSYADSELGAFKNINPTDVGGHLRGEAASSKWHLAKNVQNATHVLLDRDAAGLTFAKALEVSLETAGVDAADVPAKLQALIADGNELAYGLACTKGSADPAAAGCNVGGTGSKLVNADLGQFLFWELSIWQAFIRQNLFLK